jgi:outer membrane immunogenic protein
MRRLLIAFCLSGVGLVNAFAGDLPPKAPPMVAPAAPSWTGWYVGINGGGAWGETSSGISIGGGGFFAGAAGPAVIAGSSNSINNSGGLAGGQIGYLLQSGLVVFGVEGSFDWFRANGSASRTVVNIPAAGNAIALNESVNADWLALLTARVGFDLGAWYPYITGGLAVANLKYTHSYLDNIPPVFASNASLSQSKAGIAGGVGVEYRFDGHWSLRGEWMYMQFSGVDGTALVINTVTGLPTGNTFHHQATFYENIGRAALSYKF